MLILRYFKCVSFFMHLSVFEIELLDGFDPQDTKLAKK